MRFARHTRSTLHLPLLITGTATLGPAHFGRYAMNNADDRWRVRTAVVYRD